MNWLLLALVFGLAFLAASGWAAWLLDRPKRVPLERLAGERPLPYEQPQLPRAGRFPLPNVEVRPFAGASQTGQPVPWDLAGAAYELGQQRTEQDEITRQVDAIMLEVELDPRWRYR